MVRLIKDYVEHILLVHEENWHVKLMRSWPDMVGDLHTKMALEKIEGSILKIGVYDSHWMHELFMLSPTIVRTINSKLGGNLVSALRFGLREKRQRKERAPKASLMHQKKILLSSQQLHILEAVTDSELRVLLKNYLIRCLQ
jgi:Dna[CI] antecedent, DciA